MTTPIDLRVVARELLELTGLTIAELARRGEVHRPNCLAWLAGKEQVFSEKKQLKVCELLGWRFGRLRRDMIHRWQIGDDLTMLKQVLTAYELSDEAMVLTIFQAKGHEAEQAAIIVGICRELPPLVILIKRPLGYGMPTPITATTLGHGDDGKLEHTISQAECESCWSNNSVTPTGEEYLETHGRLLWAEARHGVLEQAGMVSIDHLPEVLQAYETDFNLEENMEWDAILHRAKHSGMSFQEILAKTEAALGLKL